jgi:hypothetical protein
MRKNVSTGLVFSRTEEFELKETMNEYPMSLLHYDHH